MGLSAFLRFALGLLAFLIALMVLPLPVHGQINSPCTATMVSSFAPCMNFVTNSSANGSAAAPNAACCNSLKSLTTGSMGCFCLILTGSVPFQLPINRTLAISLPRACNRTSVPLQCNASIAPIPAPGPVSLGPQPSPGPGGATGAPPSLSPAASSVPESDSNLSPALAPDSDTTPVLTPTSRTGSTGSDATPSFSLSPSLVILVFGAALLKYC